MARLVWEPEGERQKVDAGSWNKGREKSRMEGAPASGRLHVL